jgi:lysozyme
MSYLDTHSRTSSPTKNDLFQPTGRMPALFGVFVGFIKDAADVQRNGRLRVWIPEFGSSPDNQDGWIIVNYCSPFAGATNIDTASVSDTKTFEGTQTSYGMWMIPPDINNQVLIMFINGDPSRGIWIGSLYNQFMNNMVPGMASSTNNHQYQGKNVPVAEYNKNDTKINLPDQATKPYEATKFKGLGNQGLITDPDRGISSSSARRESPSQVFGIITPGPVIPSTDANPEKIRRKGGSSFIMDDKEGSEYVQLTTKSGAQININETNGFVYVINRDGSAWIQMDEKGNIDIFGANNISMRAQRDLNIRADRNINIEAGQNIYMKAAKDTKETTTSFTYDVNNIPKASSIPQWKYVGEGKGDGGNIVTQALNNTHTTVKNNAYLTIGTNFEIRVTGTIDASAGNEYNLTAPSIKNVGAVKVRGTLDVTGLISGSSLSLSSGITAGTIVGDFPGIRSGPGVTTGGPGPGISVPTPPDPIKAEVKPLLDKMNILATWSDPDSKFKRNSEAMQTTVTRLPTYETCPEHDAFTYKSVVGYTPIETQADKTYEGSGGAGNEATASPVPNITPGANNKEIPAEKPVDSIVTKNFNMAAYECQLKIHEGVKYVSYLDSLALPTAGIGHLLRTDEKLTYPVPTPVSKEQVTTWFNQDAPISIKGAQELLGIDVWGELSDVRKRACADLCYNMGKGRLSKFVRFIAGMKSSNWDLAGQSLRDSKWYGQVGRRGPAIITMIVNDTDPNGCDKKFPPT